MRKPIGVSAYELTRALPEELKGSLPTIEEIEAELSGRIEAAGGEQATHTDGDVGESDSD